MLPIGMVVAMTVIMMDVCGIPAAINEPEPANIVVETAIIPTEAPTQAIVAPTVTQVGGGGFTVYSIYGITPPEEWQQYLYAELEARGYGWYMPYAVCQIWQESCWNQWSDNGRDRGLCQQKAIYWESRAAHYGIPGADIWDPYAQLHVFACMMCGYLAATGGDVGRALSTYYLGTWNYSDAYVGNVLEHWDALEVVR